MINHRFVPARSGVENANKTLVTFNGTGADKHDLIGFALPIVDENTNILGLQGKYTRNRWVSSPVGTPFNLNDLEKDSGELIGFLKKLSKRYLFDLNNLVFFGFSNGANFILSFLYLNPGFCKAAVCMHCMKPINFVENKDFSSLKLVLTRGNKDQFSTNSDFAQVAGYFENNGADVTQYQYEGDHFFVGDPEVSLIRDFLLS